MASASLLRKQSREPHSRLPHPHLVLQASRQSPTNRQTSSGSQSLSTVGELTTTSVAGNEALGVKRATTTTSVAGTLLWVLERPRPDLKPW